MKTALRAMGWIVVLFSAYAFVYQVVDWCQRGGPFLCCDVNAIAWDIGKGLGVTLFAAIAVGLAVILRRAQGVRYER